MKTKTINVYSFDELSEKAKQKALENLYDINVDHDWCDFIYDDFKSICATIGVDADKKEMFFSGFSHQGSGSCFYADIDLFKLIEGIKNKEFLNYAPNLEKDNRFNVSPCDVDKRVLNLIGEGIIDCSCSFVGRERSYSVKVDYTFDWQDNKCVNYENIMRQSLKLEEWIEDIASELNSLLYSLLEKEYEYLTSEEAIIETIKSNEYEFDESGNLL